MLTLTSVTAGYGESTVLRGISLSAAAGEVVALLGPNGAGKTTLLRTASGLVKARSGTVELAGEDLTGDSPHAFTRHGICHVPEGRGIFPSLTVRENIVIQARSRPLDEAIAEATEFFPVLGSRLRQTAGSLSGGEQQMLALFRAYLTRPKIVLVDEASFGLAPLIVDKIYDALSRLAATGMSLIIVEQYVQRALERANTVYILSRGEIVHSGSAKSIAPDEIYERYLGIE
jgi:branched-chain amino acid transport system ATP-binding protein